MNNYFDFNTPFFAKNLYINGQQSIPRISMIRKVLVKTLPKAIVLFPPNEIDSVSHDSKKTSFCIYTLGSNSAFTNPSSNPIGIIEVVPDRYISLK